MLYSVANDIFVRLLWLAMASFEVQYFHEVKPNLSSVSPIIKISCCITPQTFQSIV